MAMNGSGEQNNTTPAFFLGPRNRATVTIVQVGKGWPSGIEVSGCFFHYDGNPIGSMYGIFTYIWLIFMVNVGIYTIHGSYGNETEGSHSATVIQLGVQPR